ncbi:type II toxin-antitoxin system RelE/ParE family toxin [Candidatus Woesearchaeota archaeon]|nr:type II toxin-antitoxin system RelE/ParE family toxin [Candidatus Woesearchaeota archaeon]
MSPDVINFLKKQDKHIEKRLRNGLEKLKVDNPFHYLEHFEGNDFYKYRMGDYRALVDVDFQNKILRVRILDKRSRIYK